MLFGAKPSPLNPEKNAFQTTMVNFHHTYAVQTQECWCHLHRAMTVIFHDILRDCLENYIGVTVVKFEEVFNHVNNLRKVFVRCKLYKLRMNLLQCAFSVSSENLLGFSVHIK